MLKIDTRPRKRNSAGDASKRAPGYLQWLRGRACACGGRNPDCGGRMQAAHGPDKATKGMGTKCRDSAAMPLSENCHALQHRVGWISFSVSYLRPKDTPLGGALAICEAYWRAWPGRMAWERRQRERANG